MSGVNVMGLLGNWEEIKYVLREVAAQLKTTLGAWRAIQILSWVGAFSVFVATSLLKQWIGSSSLDASPAKKQNLF